MKEIGNSLELLYLKGHEAIQVPCRGEGAYMAPNTCEPFRKATLKDQEKESCGKSASWDYWGKQADQQCGEYQGSHCLERGCNRKEGTHCLEPT